jgi:hypothetical protein
VQALDTGAHRPRQRRPESLSAVVRRATPNPWYRRSPPAPSANGMEARSVSPAWSRTSAVSFRLSKRPRRDSSTIGGSP